jgi:hypothetical protein
MDGLGMMPEFAFELVFKGAWQSNKLWVSFVGGMSLLTKIGECF